MMRLTFEHNGLIDLEEDRPAAPALRRLIELHRTGSIQVFIGNISASENLPGKVAPEHYRQFEERLERLRIADLPKLLPVVGRLGFSFWEHLGDENDTLDEQVKAIVHPTAEATFAEHLAVHGLPADSPMTPKWRNMQCDVDGMTAHIRAGHDIFVTKDDHFLREGRRQALVALGANEILTPDEALATVLGRLGVLS